MIGLGVLDVAIGLVFVYLLLSLLCSGLNELLEALLKRRARDLESGIQQMLKSPELVARVYKHGLVSSLYQGDYSDGKKTNLPSYIPSRNFALALMDVMMPADTPAASSAEQAVRLLVEAAKGDLEKERVSIEAWYDSTMDRVSGWYKRRAQIIIFVIGLGIAAALNADTIAITGSLLRDAPVRNALVGIAGEYAQANTSPQAPTPDSSSTIEACRNDTNSPECRVERNLAQIRALGLPLGWDVADGRLFPTTGIGWAMKAGGWLCTAIAVTLGAPFWFDVLNRIMVVRATVKPREKSPEEPSADR